LHPDSFLADCFWAKQSINQKTDQDASVLFQYGSGFSERHSFPLAFVCYGQWNGMGFTSDWPQHRARACQAHDTKRSDWHGTGRPEPVRHNQNNLSTMRSIKQKNSLSQPTNYSIDPKHFFQNPLYEIEIDESVG
jgi:hypothetical protein